MYKVLAFGGDNAAYADAEIVCIVATPPNPVTEPDI